MTTPLRTRPVIEPIFPTPPGSFNEPWMAQQDCRSCKNTGLFDGRNPDPEGFQNAWGIYAKNLGRIAILEEAELGLSQAQVNALAARLVVCINACAGLAHPEVLPGVLDAFTSLLEFAPAALTDTVHADTLAHYETKARVLYEYLKGG